LIVDSEEIEKYTPLTKVTMKQTMYIPYKYDIQVLTYFLYSYYADVDTDHGNGFSKDEKAKYDIKFIIEQEIHISYFRVSQLLQIEWETSPKNDLIADSICLLIMQINEKPTPQLCKLMDVAHA